VPLQNLIFLDRTFVSDRILQVLDATPKLIDLTKTFTCNGRKLVPDAIVFPTFEIEKDAKAEYSFSKHTWDDQGYWTSVTYYNSYFGRTIKIAYPGQPSQTHTIKKLREFLTSDRKLVGRSLPKEFYSYWSVESTDIADSWQAMRDLNHIFYVAVQEGFWTAEEFRQQFLTKVFHDSDYKVFRYSLFRGNNSSDVEQMFEEFVSNVLKFTVIDIKYLNLAYLQNPVNIDSLKERSIRKQFVYEYLLQQKINALATNASHQISSHFWIPSSESDEFTLSDTSTYLSGYLKLVKVNLLIVLDRYIASM
jgi:hypothetical protein